LLSVSRAIVDRPPRQSRFSRSLLPWLANGFETIACPLLLSLPPFLFPVRSQIKINDCHESIMPWRVTRARARTDAHTDIPSDTSSRADSEASLSLSRGLRKGFSSRFVTPAASSSSSSPTTRESRASQSGRATEPMDGSFLARTQRGESRHVDFLTIRREA